ncbi:MAG: hypothetical protein CVV27_07210 [Candidatus Melainabacteria bacterium HGW-Melainabacteria-1]|nr:MAG: hypothetical protein CVV27_07210 [Candidatus Melainabacteria bacterium HGW-Melainabacteria-1]
MSQSDKDEPSNLPLERQDLAPSKAEAEEQADFEDQVELTLLADLGLGGSRTVEPDGAGVSRQPRYDLLGTVGEGAMGEILLARDHELRRKVAFKKIHSEMAANHGVLQRFLTEAQITAQLDHPNIVPIYGLEVSPLGDVGYSMKLIQGKTFKQLIQETRAQLDQDGRTDEGHTQRALIEHFLKVCDAMYYAHNKGVIHRDLKPANIMVGPYNEVYVMDWGIAKIIHAHEAEVSSEVVEMIRSDAQEPPLERTQMGKIMGTPRYMSPQQAAGRNDLLDGRSDQFALGLILFELITLKPAFKAKDQLDLLKRVLKAELEPMTPYLAGRQVATELQAIVAKATAKKVDGRYAGVAELADDLRRYLRGEAVLAKPDNARQKLLRWIGHHRELTLGLVLLLALLGGGGVIASLVQQQQAMRRAQEHEQKLSRFLMQVGKRAQVIDARFMLFESLLERLAGSSEQVLEYGQPSTQPVFTHLDFYDPARKPPDLAPAPSYGVDLSLDYLTFKLSPGVVRDQAEPLMRQLAPLRHVFRQIALRSHSPEAAALPKAEADKLLRQEGVPLIWAFIGLESGMLINYPANTGYKPEYDARLRPWYTASLKQLGPRWQSPYIDTSGKGFVLPCTLPLWDSQQRFLGVAAVEITLDYIKQNFLTISEQTGFVAAYLIDGQGRVVVSSREQSASFAVGTLVNQARELETYGRPEVVSQLRAQASGYLEYREGTQRRVLAYYPLRSLGWSYLVEAATADLDIKPAS